MNAHSGYFFSLEKKNGQGKHIHSLLSDNSSWNATRHHVDLEEDFNRSLLQVSADTKTQLSRPLQLEELPAFLQSMSGEKLHGSINFIRKTGTCGVLTCCECQRGVGPVASSFSPVEEL